MRGQKRGEDQEEVGETVENYHKNLMPLFLMSPNSTIFPLGFLSSLLEFVRYTKEITKNTFLRHLTKCECESASKTLKSIFGN